MNIMKGDKVYCERVNDASSVGYLGFHGIVTMIHNGLYLVKSDNSDAWFEENELVKIG